MSEKKEVELVIEVEKAPVEAPKVEYDKADATLRFVELVQHRFAGAEFTEAEDSALNKKLYFILLPLICTINTLLFIDKSTLSYSSILGLYESTGINTAQFDDLQSIFYAGYIVGQVLNFALQRHNLANFITAIIFLWAVLVFCHCGARNFGGLVALRFLLGFLESVVVPALEITMLQFFTPRQRATLQPVFWISCVGSPVVIGGFAAYGVLHATHTIPPWKLFMIINGGLTLILSIVVALLYPGDPSRARFLTDKERYFLIKKVQRASKASIAQHTVKRSQLSEGLRDPITWLFGAFCFLLMLANNLNYQQNLLYVSLGVSTLGSTLVSVAGGGFATGYAVLGAFLTHFFPDSSFWMIVAGCLPSVASGIAMVTIPWDNKLGLLAALVLGANTYFLAYIVGLGWSTSSCSGNTKRYLRHAVFNFFYGVSNVVSPQIWRGNQAPRYYAAWSIQIVLAWFGAPVVAGIITHILKGRNKKRLADLAVQKGAGAAAIVGTIVRVDASTGSEFDQKADIANLDLTDLENKAFIYPL